ncbi:LOW QUALITY PROTEIN: hypothetical protein U9M48_028607 [Paspalum notatum var. saurae]|uniref:Uncharacterized protein n=1 Tax=Paspalum notatum var. saurae TaxID=547442 RepID=A0AAQ3U1M1_PASNO
MTFPRREHAAWRQWRRGNSGGLVIHRVTKEISSSGSFPTLTKTNYYDWADALLAMVLEISWMTTTPTKDGDELDDDHSYDRRNS